MGHVTLKEMPFPLIAHVPCAEVLFDRWDQYGDFGEAFVSWADDLLAGYDRAHAEQRLPGQKWVDREAVASALACRGGQFGYWTELRALLRPLHGGRTTISEVAEMAGIDAETAIGVLFSQRGMPHWRDYVECEREILMGTDKWAAELSRQYAIDDRTVTGMAERHGVTLPGPVSPKRHPMRVAAVELLDAGHGTRATLDILSERYGEEGLPSMRTLSQWNTRATRRRALQEDDQ